ncbi:MAG: flagellar basal body L-ring protein FlgH [Magnetovibrionaceae bacterium]
MKNILGKIDTKTTKRALRIGVLLTATVALSACNVFTRLSEVGGDPQLSDITNPVSRPSYEPVSMPMPAPQRPEANPNSLWRAGAKAFFKDHRAKTIGDILTVKLDLSDSASLENSTERQRDDSEDSNISAILGYETEFDRIFPPGVNPASLISWDTNLDTNGDGNIERKETISLTFAAVITQVLPNGNLVLIGRQELRVNRELRELLVSGVINPGDIDPDNTIEHEKIAEMRVAYGGRGTLSDLQSPRWGAQVWDILFPF